MKIFILANFHKEVLELGPIKFAIAVMVKLKKEAEYTTPRFRTEQIVSLSEHEIAEALNGIPSFLQERLEKFVNLRSGWKLKYVEIVRINVAKYQPLNGASYLRLPKKLGDK